jgi:hypothetical protein
MRVCLQTLLLFLSVYHLIPRYFPHKLRGLVFRHCCCCLQTLLLSLCVCLPFNPLLPSAQAIKTLLLSVSVCHVFRHCCCLWVCLPFYPSLLSPQAMRVCPQTLLLSVRLIAILSLATFPTHCCCLWVCLPCLQTLLLSVRVIAILSLTTFPTSYEGLSSDIAVVCECVCHFIPRYFPHKLWGFVLRHCCCLWVCLPFYPSLLSPHIAAVSESVCHLIPCYPATTLSSAV